MYPNLMAEMIRHGVEESDIAKMLGVTTRTVKNKLRGESDFGFREVVKIKQAFFPECSYEYLMTSKETHVA